jgi:segregation and condensation protein B
MKGSPSPAPCEGEADSERLASVSTATVVAPEVLRNTLEAALLAAGRPLTLEALCDLFVDEADPGGAEAAGAPGPEAVREALARLAQDYAGRAIELREVASGFRVQVRPEYGPRLARLSAERPTRYSRALLETLALVAYRQPISRGEIEEVRGVAVSTSIFKTLQEREWIRVVGHRDTPGRPAIYGTTRQFLDDFNLKRLAELPPLAELQDLDRAADDLARAMGDAVAPEIAALPADASEGVPPPGPAAPAGG